MSKERNAIVEWLRSRPHNPFCGPHDHNDVADFIEQQYIPKPESPKPDDESLEAAARSYTETRRGHQDQYADIIDAAFKAGAKHGEAKGYEKGRADGWLECVEHLRRNAADIGDGWKTPDNVLIEEARRRGIKL